MSKAFVPESRDELALWLNARSSSTAIRGTTDQPGAIVMRNLNRLVGYEPGEMIVQVEAGMTLSALDRELRARSQWIPSLQPQEDSCTTVGGALSCDLYHPRARHTMTLRTAVLGGTFCTTDGELFRSGSRVVKSVAGYDTHRAFVGARGTLGVIVEVTLRVLPLPEQILRFQARPDCRSLISRESPSVLEAVGDTLLFELSGYTEDVLESRDRLDAAIDRELSDDEWVTTIHLARNSRPRTETPQNSATLMQRLQHAMDPKGVLRGI